MSIAPGLPDRMAVRSVEVADSGDLLARLPETSALAWVRRGEGLVGWGEAARIPVPAGSDRFACGERALRALFDDADVDDTIGVPGSGPVAFGSFTFDPQSTGSVLIVPRVVVGRRSGIAWMTTIGDSEDQSISFSPVEYPVNVRWSDGNLPPPAWQRAVQRAVAAIQRGPVDKVVLCRDIQAQAAHPIDPRALLRRLGRAYPDCYTFSCNGLVGATPELLVRKDAGTVESLVLAGSIGRGKDASEDAARGAALLASDKDVEEHEFAVESLRTALAPLCDRLEVDESPSLLVLANIQHLATRVSGRLAEPLSVLEIAGALHPTAAVCGTPTDGALDLVRELEGTDRGRYAGPVGWVDGMGNGEWGIALRCAQVDGSQARLFAGVGVVAGSDPEAELAETQAKLKAMQYALEG